MPSQIAVKTMKAVQIGKAGGPWEVVDREIPEPGTGQVRIKVEACGICHSDVIVKEGVWPVSYPRVPGHEIAGRIDAVGSGETLWKQGQRVGVGWHGGHCFQCNSCRRGDFMLCQNAKVTGWHFDGGYEEFVIVPSEGGRGVLRRYESIFDSADWFHGQRRHEQEAIRRMRTFFGMSGGHAEERRRFGSRRSSQEPDQHSAAGSKEI